MSNVRSNNSSDASPKCESTSNAGPTLQKGYSCVLCAQRKVKCDKLPGGCANCTKIRAACVYKPPPPPRRRKKGVRDVDATTRIRLYEKVLRQLGADTEEIVKQELAKMRETEETEDVQSISGFPEPYMPLQTRQSHLPPEAGILVIEDGRSRYLENGIWTSLKTEFREPKEILGDSSDEELDDSPYHVSPAMLTSDGAALLFGSQCNSARLQGLHPDPIQTLKLWQAYLDNINPLVKVFHAPTIQRLIADISGNMDDVPRDLEALLFGIYCITVESLSDGECVSIFGEGKASVTQRFRLGAQQALINANLLRTSNLMVLQAFTLFIRIGQRIGLHRDGEKLGLPPFEVEMRRRLWWQIMMIEGFSQKLAGTGNNVTILMGDVKMPSNLNDNDLFPSMTEKPKEHKGATEMMFFLIRCFVGEFLKRSAETHTSFDGVWHRLTSTAVHVSMKEKAVLELESLFQRKFLRYCDQSIPWHLMCTQLAKAIIFTMRFMVHSTNYGGTSETDVLFDLALQVVVTQNLAYTTPEMQGFIWHVNLNFQWKAFIYLVSALRCRTQGQVVDKAWKEIEKAYDFHPSFDSELAVRALPIAVNNLTLKAWEAYAKARILPSSAEPNFIQLIRRRQRQSRIQRPPKPKPAAPAMPDLSAMGLQPVMHHDGDGSLPPLDPLQAFQWNIDDLNTSLGFTPDVMAEPLQDPEQMNWQSWDHLLVDFGTGDGTDWGADALGYGYRS